MQIVDAQIHTWGSGLPSNQSHIQVTHFTPEETIALMDQGGVDAAVIHPPGWDPKSTEMAFAAVRNYPGRFAIMGALPLDRPESRARIATWRDQPGMLGLRYGFLSDPARRWLADGTLDWLWVEAEKAGVPIAMLATDSLAEIGRIAERHPGLRLTIDHLGGRGGTSTLKDAVAMTHIPQLLALAKFPNVAVKATGQAGYALDQYPFPSIHDALHRVFDAFGPRRMVLRPSGSCLRHTLRWLSTSPAIDMQTSFWTPRPAMRTPPQAMRSGAACRWLHAWATRLPDGSQRAS